MKEDVKVPNGIANLTSQTGETIRIDFCLSLFAPNTGFVGLGGARAEYPDHAYGTSESASADLVPGAAVPGGASDSDQAVILQNPGGRVYSGTVPYDIMIRSRK